MADRIVDIVSTVKIPVDGYDDAVSDVLAEVEDALQRCGVSYVAPEVRRTTTDG